MRPQLSSYLRYGLIAIGLSAGAMCAPAAAGPSGYLAPPDPFAQSGSSSPAIVEIQSRRWMRGSRGGNFSGRDWSGSRNWSGGRTWTRHGNRSGRNWSRHGSWSRHGNWSGRHWKGGHWNNGHWDYWWPGYRTGLLFSFGLPAYRYYDPYWYGDPYVYAQPRRIYRTYAMSADHVSWCHNRWRSYRESDNSYQPYHGPRRQCRSPYG